MHCREYEPKDKQAVLEITKEIWDGNDFLPSWIDQYYNDPNSFPCVLEDEGMIRCVSNMRLISDDITWLEAMRTHPKFQGKGYATQLTLFLVGLARRMGIERVWLSTASNNPATRKFLKHLDFAEIMRIKVWSSTYQGDTTKGLTKEGILLDMQYFDHYFHSDAKLLRKEWKVLDSKAKLSHLLANNVVLGEFKVLPSNSYELEWWIEEGTVYVQEQSNSVLSIRKSGEYDNLIVLGLTSQHKHVLEAALLFTRELFPNKEIKIFYPEELTHSLFDLERRFRIMEFIL